MRKQRNRLSIVALAGTLVTATLIAFAYSNCGEQKGTAATRVVSVGNPHYPSTLLLSDICLVLTKCNAGLDTDVCRLNVERIRNLPESLGLSSANFATLSDVTAAEISGAVTSNPDSFSSCRNEIQTLTCDNPAVTSSYNASLANPFSNVSVLIPNGPESCKDSFLPVPQAIVKKYCVYSDLPSIEVGKTITCPNHPGSLVNVRFLSSCNVQIFNDKSCQASTSGLTRLMNDGPPSNNVVPDRGGIVDGGGIDPVTYVPAFTDRCYRSYLADKQGSYHVNFTAPTLWSRGFCYWETLGPCDAGALESSVATSDWAPANVYHGTDCSTYP